MSLSIQSLPASIDTEQELVLIHGWGISSRVWQPLLPQLQQFATVHLVDLPGFGNTPMLQLSLDALLEQLAEQLPDQCVVMGFSLGGMLALQLAERFPKQVQAVVTVASNLRFVACDSYPQAMPVADFEAFYQGVVTAHTAMLKRFAGMQCRGADDEKTLLRTVRALADDPAPSQEALLQGLDWLAALDSSDLLAGLSQPRLHMLGGQDQLVPQAAAEVLQGRGEEVAVFAGASHLPFLSHSAGFIERLQGFLRTLSPKQLQKQAVAASFSRAAASYDDVAQLQRDVGTSLLASLPDGKVEVVLDLGCGTGYFQQQLAEATACDTLIGLDLAEGMLAYAKGHHAAANSSWVGGDAEQLPLANDSVDIIFSSLAIQWCENPSALFAEVQRVLKPGGRFVFSTLGPETLKELRAAWREVDDYVHVNRFLPREQLLGAEAKLAIQEQFITLRYQKLNELTRELKGLGAHNVNAGRPAGLTGKHRALALKAAYEQFRDSEGWLPATYQVWFGEYRKQAQ